MFRYLVILFLSLFGVTVTCGETVMVNTNIGFAIGLIEPSPFSDGKVS